jgi:hypothetical protein
MEEEQRLGVDTNCQRKSITVLVTVVQSGGNDPVLIPWKLVIPFVTVVHLLFPYFPYFPCFPKMQDISRTKKSQGCPGGFVTET